MAPNMTMARRKLTPDDTRKMPTRNKLGGRIGSEARRSQKMNEVMNATAVMPRAMISGEPQPYWVPPQTVTSRVAVMATISRTAPR